MKLPILLERAFRGFRKVNKPDLEWVKYAVLVVAMVITVFALIMLVVDSTVDENAHKSKQCAVAYNSPDWEHERHDTNPDDSSAPVIDRCINPKNNNEVKDFPKEEKK